MLIQNASQIYDETSYAVFMENAMLQMKTSNVTTVACLCRVNYVGSAMRAATHQGYFPEWLVPDYLSNETSSLRQIFGSPEQRGSLMFLLAHPMERAPADHPSTWALQEARHAGYPLPTDIAFRWFLDLTYWMLLVPSSGFQLAGPHLTPETFERGSSACAFRTRSTESWPGRWALRMETTR